MLFYSALCNETVFLLAPRAIRFSVSVCAWPCLYTLCIHMHSYMRCMGITKSEWRWIKLLFLLVVSNLKIIFQVNKSIKKKSLKIIMKRNSIESVKCLQSSLLLTSHILCFFRLTWELESEETRVIKFMGMLEWTLPAGWNLDKEDDCFSFTLLIAVETHLTLYPRDFVA